MFSLSRLAGLALCGLALCVGCERGPAPPPVEPVAANGPAHANAVSSVAAGRTRIVFLGDSLSAGYGLPEDQAFPALVERALQDEGLSVDVLNAGVSGDTSAGGVSRLDWVLGGEPAVVVVELGGNDALRGQPLANTEKNLREIVARARSSGARVLLLGMDVPTNYGAEYTSAFAALYPRIAAELDVAFLPGFVREVGLDPTLLQPDGLHPTPEGHRRMAESLLPALRGLLADGVATANDRP